MVIKKKMLGKLKMPVKREEEMDLSELDSEPEMDTEEQPMEAEQSEEAPADMEDKAAALSDEELMAEIEKRGLMGKLHGEPDADDEEPIA